MFAPLPAPDSGSKKFEVTRGVPGTAGEVGRKEGLGGGTGGKHFSLVQRNVETIGGEAGDQVAEERADAWRRHQPKRHRRGKREEVDRVDESREGQATDPGDDG